MNNARYILRSKGHRWGIWDRRQGKWRGKLQGSPAGLGERLDRLNKSSS